LCAFFLAALPGQVATVLDGKGAGELELRESEELN
jgi:hypothetical protein